MPDSLRTSGAVEAVHNVATGNFLSITNLTVSFDGFKAVDDLNFSVDEGELRVVIGPNGAGKTTLLGYDLRKNEANKRHD